MFSSTQRKQGHGDARILESFDLARENRLNATSRGSGDFRLQLRRGFLHPSAGIDRSRKGVENEGGGQEGEPPERQSVLDAAPTETASRFRWTGHIECLLQHLIGSGN